MRDRVSRSGYRPDIQGLRAVAVLSVLAFHAALPGWQGGYLGVDVFFVISGYLIGGQLVRELQLTGRLRFAEFYARRARRILPAALTVIVLTVLGSLVFAPPLRAPGIAVDAIWAALSAANIRFAIERTDYLNGVTPSPLQHYWSLGVEEQFYVLLPLLLLGLFVAFGPRRAAIVAAGVLLITVSFTVCLIWGVASPWSYFTIPARAWELGIGVLTAAVAVNVSQLGGASRQALASGGALCLLTGAVLGGTVGFPHPGIGTLLPAFGTAALVLAGEGGADRVPLITRALGVPAAQFIGNLSFSLYLVHWPILALAQENSNSEQPLPLAMRLLLAGVSLPFAWLLWRFVERPFLSQRLAAVRGRRSVVIAVAVTAALVVSLTVAVPALASRPLASDRVATSHVTLMPSGTGFVPENMRPSLTGAADDTGELYTDGCQQNASGSALKVCTFGGNGDAGEPTVVLFGDSHAGRWFPAFQAAFAGRAIRLVTLTKSGCRSLESAKLWSAAENRSCATWRASAVDWLAAHPPQLLVLANHLGRSTGDPSTTEAHWREATETTLARFAAGVPVALLSETPEFDFSPPVCLSRHLEDARACREARVIAVNTPVITAVREGAIESGATSVDLTDWFCNANDCPTIIGSTLVYSDEHHLSATFTAQLGHPVYAALAPLIATG